MNVAVILCWVVGVMLLCSVLPCVLFMWNLRRYAAPPPARGEPVSVAVLIPARNEAANIGDALRCVLASGDVQLEVIVLDDGSTDDTAEIVASIAEHDDRVRLVAPVTLPAGWNGKQHACWRLAEASATGPNPASLLLFLDADVRLAPAAIARMAAFQQRGGAALVSGFPRLVTVGWLEWMLLPMIHFVLLGFLPMGRMRETTDPSVAAGCGQFMLASRDAYVASGGHAAIRATMHDGLLLPRAFRRAGFRTDIADITGLASVRMYDSAAKVWQGLAKNATEGIAAPTRIVPLTLLLLIGQVLPVVAATCCVALMTSVAIMGAVYDFPTLMAWLYGGVALAVVCSFLPRLLAVRRFRQPLRSALLHPLGMLLLLCVQWYALARQGLGRPVGWRQRAYASASSGEVGPV